MARGRQAASLDTQIAKAEEKVAKYKVKYDDAVAALKVLKKQKEAAKKEKIVDAILASSKDYDTIMNFLQE